MSTAGTSAGTSPLFFSSTGRVGFDTASVRSGSAAPFGTVALIFFLDVFGTVFAFLLVLADAWAGREGSDVSVVAVFLAAALAVAPLADRVTAMVYRLFLRGRGGNKMGLSARRVKLWDIHHRTTDSDLLAERRPTRF